MCLEEKNNGRIEAVGSAIASSVGFVDLDKCQYHMHGVDLGFEPSTDFIVVEAVQSFSFIS